jgi:HNH endonuclease
MADNILAYIEMCQREGTSLQRGMNFGLGRTYSVVLMSVRPNAPYRDRFDEDGTVLIYEGHDEPKGTAIANPKAIDQPEYTAKGTLTENGKFHSAAQAYTRGDQPVERVRVYEKIRNGIWAYNGIFHLQDSWREYDGQRQVFKFKLVAVAESEDLSQPARANPERRRIIPTWVKLAVWKRDNGQCVQCGSKDELHFDHILPFAKGGASATPNNVQLLCARHNLEKHDKIV